MTFLQLKQKLRNVLWPSGEQASLRTAHDGFFVEAMQELQRDVECLRVHNVTQYNFANTFWQNGLTVLNAPYGEVRRVYTVANEDFSDPVSYRSETYDEILCWSKQLWEAIPPTVTAGEELPMGFRAADSSSDSQFGRARVGAWAIYRNRLYIAPWIQSNEIIYVDWDGEKASWADTDLIDEKYWRALAQSAISYYVAFKHETFYGEKTEAAKFLELYRAALSDLIWECREFTRKKPDHACDNAGADGDLTGLTQDRIDDDESNEEEEQQEQDHVLFNAVGDVGDTGDDAAAVAAKVNADGPEVFLALGDLSYSGNYDTDFDANYGDLLEAGKVVPVIGNHDYSEFGNSFAAFKAHFADVISNNGENFEFVIGPVHFLIYNTENTDGVNVDSEQAEWLHAKLMLSPARWKIVLMHRPPFSSDTTHGSDAALQLPFGDWGADLVLAAHGHDYERLEVDDLPYIVVGTGGHGLYTFGSPVTGSQIRYNSKYGRLIGEADCDQLVLTFKTVDDDVIDTLTLTKD